MLAVASCVSASASAQNLHYGMNTRVLTPQMADKMAELGAGVVRLVFGWDVIEPASKGGFTPQSSTNLLTWRLRFVRELLRGLAYIAIAIGATLDDSKHGQRNRNGGGRSNPYRSVAALALQPAAPNLITARHWIEQRA